jgi:hypothetical protein
MPTKFKNHKVTGSDGFTYDSKFEHQVYLGLCQEYTKVWRQVPIPLMPVTQVYATIGHKPQSKKTLDVRKYIMDFVVMTTDGRYIAVEAKGVKTQLYMTKRDIFLWQYIEDEQELILDGNIITLSEYQVINMKLPIEIYRRYEPKRKRLL